MSTKTTRRISVTRSYRERHKDPIKHADEILAVRIIRDPGTHPSEPLRLGLDQSAIDHMGWRAGDAITLEPVFPEPGRSEGKIIIRKARPGELAFLLGEPPIIAERDFEGFVGMEYHGSKFEWCFPEPWVESFFPGDYDADDHDFNSQTQYVWMLSTVLREEGRIVLPLGPEYLFLYIQRTTPTPTTLDIHLIPGVLHLMGWSRSTPLVLESASGFDPFADEDQLTIREPSLGEEPNLTVWADRWTVEVNPLWLDRFLPDVFDDSEVEDPPAHRDTIVVDYGEMTREGHSLSFPVTRALSRP